MVQLRSRWPRIREGEPWRQIADLVRPVERPHWLDDPQPPGTRAILAGVEATLLLPTPGRLSMARQYVREVPYVLEHVDEVVRYYQAFELETSSELEIRVRASLDRIVTLDFAHNALTSIPTSVFRHLRALSHLELSHNAFAALPLAIGRLPHLQRLRTAGNPLRRPNAAALLRQARAAPRVRAGVPSLVQIALRIAKASGVSPEGLPPHLADTLAHGYVCAARTCTSTFVTAGDPRWLDAPIYLERLVLDQRLTFGGARLCSECMLKLR